VPSHDDDTKTITLIFRTFLGSYKIYNHNLQVRYRGSSKNKLTMSIREIARFLVAIVSLTIIINNLNVTATSIVKLGECKAECVADIDCMLGLLCTNAHRQDLYEQGYNPRRAYCPRTKDSLNIIVDPVTNKTIKLAKRVCYDPRKLVPKNVTTTTNCPKPAHVQVPATPTKSPLLRVPIKVPVLAPTKPTLTMPEKCPNSNIKDGQSCDFFDLSSCFIGEPVRTCYRKITSILSRGKVICNDIEQCIWGIKQCRCNSKFGWMCQSVEPDWVESSKCSN
jgi:hypothetical protein